MMEIWSFFLSSLSEEYNQRLVGSEWKDSGTSPFVAFRRDQGKQHPSNTHQTCIKHHYHHHHPHPHHHHHHPQLTV
jgi:hypothetical protein